MGWSPAMGAGQAVICRSFGVAYGQALAVVGGSATMTGVKQVRVVRNVLLWASLCTLVLWLVGVRLWAHWTAIVFGVVAGSGYAIWHWRHLARRITRHDRHFEPKKIFVHYLRGCLRSPTRSLFPPLRKGAQKLFGHALSIVEVLVSAVVYSPFGAGECVEAIAVERLTLYVYRAPPRRRIHDSGLTKLGGSAAPS